MAIRASKCITVHEITIKNGTERRQDHTVTIPQALRLLFAFPLESRDCRIEHDGDILLVAEDLSCGDLQQINFTGNSDDMKTLFWAKNLFFAAHDWQEKYAVDMIERMFQVNGYPAWNRIAGRMHRTSHGHVSYPEKIWSIVMYACGVFDQNHHDAVIKLLKPTGRWKGWKFTYREEDLVSLLEWHLEDPTISFRELIEYGASSIKPACPGCNGTREVCAPNTGVISCQLCTSDSASLQAKYAIIRNEQKQTLS